MRSPPAGPKRLTTLSLAAATFFIVSGGPYGLEEIVQAHGYGRALVLIAALPVVWALPVALLVGELGSALPRTGGYYEWVRLGLGEFWGLQEAWLSMAYTVVDLTLYPTMLAAYLGKLWPAFAANGRGAPGWWLGVALVAGGTLWNALGIRAVGLGAEAVGALVLSPFAAMAALAAWHLPESMARAATALAAAPTASAAAPTFAAGLLVALWNYLGFDNASTFAGEVRDPQRAYPRAMLSTLALVAAAYGASVLSSAAAGNPAAQLETGGWVLAARALGGEALGAAVAAGGAITMVGMFTSILLSWSRLPVALAEDGYLPRGLARRSARTGAPVPALLLGAALVALCVGLRLDQLVVIDVLLYGAALLLEFAALVALRVRRPDLPRPFRVPGGTAGAAALGVAPAAIVVYAFWASRHEPGAFGVAALPLTASVAAAGLVVWAAGRLLRRRAARPSPTA